MGRVSKQQRLDMENHHNAMTEMDVNDSAKAQYNHAAYQSYTVSDYLNKMGVDVKGEMPDGQEGAKAVPTTAKGDTAS